MDASTPSRRNDLPKAESIAVAGLLAAFAAILLRTAWLCDDAFITFRTVDNFIHGHGLRWNPAERVWSFTSVLWTLVLSAASAITREVPTTAMLLGAATSVLAAWIVAFRLAVDRGAAFAAVLVLFFSRSMVDYSTSGLENPLSHLAIALVAMQWLKDDRDAAWLRRLWLWGAMAMLTRHDLAVLVFPAMAAGVLQCRASWPARIGAAAIGIAPFVAWELFAIFYFGFPFPNTAYAKLGTGIPGGEVARQGIVYCIDLLSWDVLGAVAIGAGIVVPMFRPFRRLLPIGIGCLLYCLYVVKVGGDFMSGRFFTIPIFAAVVVLSRLPLGSAGFAPVVAAAAVAALGMAAERPAIFVGRGYRPAEEDGMRESKIVDERGWYHFRTALLERDRDTLSKPLGITRADGMRALKMKVIVHDQIGLDGFDAGPDVHFIDLFALADPLLARLPAYEAPDWRTGHFARYIPIGYRQSVESGVNVLADRDLSEYYDRLQLVVSAPLLSPGRLAEIVRFNTGGNDSLIDAAAYRDVDSAAALPSGTETGLRWRAELDEIGEPLADGTGVEIRPHIKLLAKSFGFRLSMGALRHDRAVELRVDDAVEIKLYFYNGREKIGERLIHAEELATGAARIELHESVVAHGYDELWVVATGKRLPTVLHSLRLRTE